VPLDEQGGRTVSLAFVFLLSTQFLFGWQYAVLGAIVSMVIVQCTTARAPSAPCSTGLLRAVGVRLGRPGFILGWTVSPHTRERLTALVFMGGAAYVVTNVITVATAVSLYTGISMREMLEDYVRHSGPALRDHGLHRRAGHVAVDDQPAAGAVAGRTAVRAGAVPALRLPLGGRHA
jgi:hypothetical protein